MSFQEKNDDGAFDEVGGEVSGRGASGSWGEVWLEALGAMGHLSRVLAAVKGEPLMPEQRACDRLTGFGRLAELLSASPWRERLEEGLEADDVDGVREVWEAAVGSSWEVSRCAALLYRGWGWGALSRGDAANGMRWLREGLRIWEHLVCEGEVLKMLDGGEGERWRAAAESDSRSSCGVLEALLEALALEHVNAALAAMDAHKWEAAMSHWRVVKGAVASRGRWGRSQRDELVGRWLFHASALEHAGASRGVVAADLSAARLVSEGLKLEPDERALHERQLGLLARLGGALYSTEDWGGLREVVSLSRATMSWCEARRGVFDADTVLSERLAQVSVFAATLSEHPGVAARHLRRALRACPTHPTAASLLGQSMAALAARLMGAGRHADARRVLIGAQEHLEATPEIHRLLRALDLPPLKDATDDEEVT